MNADEHDDHEPDARDTDHVDTPTDRGEAGEQRPSRPDEDERAYGAAVTVVDEAGGADAFVEALSSTSESLFRSTVAGVFVIAQTEDRTRDLNQEREEHRKCRERLEAAREENIRLTERERIRNSERGPKVLVSVASAFALALGGGLVATSPLAGWSLLVVGALVQAAVIWGRK